MPSIASADSYLLADLQSYSGLPAPVASRRLHAELKVATQTWFEKYRSNTRAADAESRALHALNPAVFATSTYPGAGATQLRFCSDFMAYFFMLDDIAEERDLRDNVQIADIVLNALNHPTTDKLTARLAIMSRDLMRRFAMTGTATVQRRFITAFGYYFQGLEEQTQLRVQGRIPTLDEYIRIRRDTTGCKLCWVIVEWAYNIDLPEEVFSHPVIFGLGQATNDFVAWSNDLYSYSAERAKGHDHNMISVLMHHDRDMDLAAATEFVGEMCKEAIDRFNRLRAELPSWGEDVDSHVARYVHGLSNWIVGIVHWSFQTERYFGKAVGTVRATKRVQLMPIRSQ